MTKLAKLSQKQSKKISQEEIKNKINLVKSLAFHEKPPKSALKRELVYFEKYLESILLLEKNLERSLLQKEQAHQQQISSLKKQIAGLRQKIVALDDSSLKKKVERLSHFIGDLMARHSVKKEVRFEQAKHQLSQKKLVSPLTLKKINDFQQKILALKSSGNYSQEKIAALEQRLTALEKRLDPRSLLKENKKKEAVRHHLLFGPSPSFAPLPTEEKPEEKKPEENAPPPSPPPKKQ